MSRSLALLLAVATTLAACTKAREGEGPGATADAQPAADAAPGPSTRTASVDAGAKSARSATYAGTYTLTPGTLYVPASKEYASVRQAKDDPQRLVGEGTLTLTVDADGKIRGTVDTGPASPGLIDGATVEGELRGIIRRRDPSDEGLSGTFSAKVQEDTATGSLSLAESSAALVRAGKLSLKRR